MTAGALTHAVARWCGGIPPSFVDRPACSGTCGETYEFKHGFDPVAGS